MEIQLNPETVIFQKDPQTIYNNVVRLLNKTFLVCAEVFDLTKLVYMIAYSYVFVYITPSYFFDGGKPGSSEIAQKNRMNNAIAKRPINTKWCTKSGASSLLINLKQTFENDIKFSVENNVLHVVLPTPLKPNVINHINSGLILGVGGAVNNFGIIPSIYSKDGIVNNVYLIPQAIDGFDAGVLHFQLYTCEDDVRTFSVELCTFKLAKPVSAVGNSTCVGSRGSGHHHRYIANCTIAFDLQRFVDATTKFLYATFTTTSPGMRSGDDTQKKQYITGDFILVPRKRVVFKGGVLGSIGRRLIDGDVEHLISGVSSVVKPEDYSILSIECAIPTKVHYRPYNTQKKIIVGSGNFVLNGNFFGLLANYKDMVRGYVQCRENITKYIVLKKMCTETFKTEELCKRAIEYCDRHDVNVVEAKTLEAEASVTTDNESTKASVSGKVAYGAVRVLSSIACEQFTNVYGDAFKKLEEYTYSMQLKDCVVPEDTGVLGQSVVGKEFLTDENRAVFETKLKDRLAERAKNQQEMADGNVGVDPMHQKRALEGTDESTGSKRVKI